MIIPDKGRGFGKEAKRQKEIQEFRKQAEQSLIRRYSNGFEAHWIDKHPHGRFYRLVGDESTVSAFLEETIMLLNTSGVVVMFLEKMEDLDRIEREMRLESIVKR